jgi:hypothetical protein
LVRTKTSAIPVLAILLLGLIMPLMMNQAKARFPTAPLITSVTPIAPPSPAPTAMPTTALATVGQYLPVVAAVIILAAIIVGLFVKKRKHPRFSN